MAKEVTSRETAAQTGVRPRRIIARPKAAKTNTVPEIPGFRRDLGPDPCLES